MQLIGSLENPQVILSRGEKLVEGLTSFAKEHDLKGGFISGLGALSDVELGYYHLPTKTYQKKTFTEEYELISLTGNISLKDGEPFVHVHCTIGDHEYRVFGGHLFEATVAVTAEVGILPQQVMPHRVLNEDIGLALICGHV